MNPSAKGAPRSLLDQRITRGERWIFSAGFNVAPGRDTGRIDIELDDIARLADAGARVAVLSHQGSHKHSTARHLGDVAAYLSSRLDRKVAYVPENATDAAIARSHTLAPGEVALFGNTRHHLGEEANDSALAARFARLGDKIAIGGFSKAHRCHASNTGLLTLRPGWAAHSLLTETERLSPWSGADPSVPSLAVLGGVKPEKTLIGLRSLCRVYDTVVPGGAVLNHILHALGHQIGDSELGEQPKRCARASDEIMRSTTARVHIPGTVVIARRSGNSFTTPREIRTADGVPPGYAIVDFRLEAWLADLLQTFRGTGCRAVLAGTPTLYSEGFRHASAQLLDWASAPRIEAILLGGDTVSELPFDGPTSTGGGSALYYLGNADLPVLRALRENASMPWMETGFGE
ncbi:phosphoglycerate kinase [Streptomyces sp. NPDC101455]|uniref:phosphoglycerate kinase n=1 Tax=Streptomyces sp. NPDC101455 TaxID=3366142 RepID=UPI0037F2FDEF